MLNKNNRIKAVDKISFINKNIKTTTSFKVVFGVYNTKDIIQNKDDKNCYFTKVRVIISKKTIKLAVNRNKIKRRIYYFLINNNLLKDNYMYVITVIKKNNTLKYKDIEKELLFLK
ncbi:MAG: ribonuclease P protein component [Cyanobium sp. MAG06]|nr:ribonuclease P protein component [Cyanobium sp. MAG06]